jgi:hypothetical protein
MKSIINDYCGIPDNQPSMSAESVAAEIRQRKFCLKSATKTY